MRRNKHGKTLVGGVFAALALALALGACTGGSEGGSLALGPTTTTTSVAEPATTTTTTAPAAPATTSVRPVATTLPAPVVVDGIPQVRATPARASVGDRVRIEGTGFTAENWKTANLPLWLSAMEAPCALYAETNASVTVTADGRLSGSFTVPASGHCRQSDIDEMPLVSGRYHLNFQCTVCRIGQIQIDAPPPPASSLRCNNVGFAPNSDNLASEIIATGVSCAEAEALVRKVGAPLGPVNGAPRAEADGWVCLRTGGSDEGRGLPYATYECRNGNRTITFTR